MCLQAPKRRVAPTPAGMKKVRPDQQGMLYRGASTDAEEPPVYCRPQRLPRWPTHCTRSGPSASVSTVFPVAQQTLR